MGKTKAVLYYVIMVGLICGFIEITARVAYFLIFKQKYVAEEIYGTIKQKDTGAKIYEGLAAEGIIGDVIHPYVGYVRDFGDEEKNQKTLGFPTLAAPMVKKAPDRLNVAVVGGSVAEYQSKFIEKALKEVTKINLAVVGLAAGGYKQPQQLLILNYLLSLGAEYDLVINIDGFNDIVLPMAENYKAGVNPFFPRSWHLRMMRRPNKEVLYLIGKVEIRREAQRQAMQGLAKSPFRFSAVYGTVRTLQLRGITNDIYKTSQKLFEAQYDVDKNYEQAGPKIKYADLLQLYNDAADVWVRSSLLINSLSNENNFEYYHFLQPNQHFKGSKPLTKEENEEANKAFYHEAAFRGYTILVEKSKVLSAKEKFFDATMLFAKEKETIYRDGCCHYNVKGNEMLASYIVQKIMEHTKNSKLKGTTH
jgi:hypothetical protein